MFPFVLILINEDENKSKSKETLGNNEKGCKYAFIMSVCLGLALIISFSITNTKKTENDPLTRIKEIIITQKDNTKNDNNVLKIEIEKLSVDTIKSTNE